MILAQSLFGIMSLQSARSDGLTTNAEQCSMRAQKSDSGVLDGTWLLGHAAQIRSSHIVSAILNTNAQGHLRPEHLIRQHDHLQYSPIGLAPPLLLYKHSFLTTTSLGFFMILSLHDTLLAA